MAAEIEAKMKVEGFDSLRNRLAERGAHRVGSALETNTFFDTPDRSLLAKDKGLRIRRTRDDVSGRERFVVTFKGPQQNGPLKRREEVEVEVVSGDDAERLLKALGYDPTLSFQKRRESWKLDECKVELDELPILGRFVEIEGPDQATVMRVREKLHMSDQPLIKTSYIAILAAHLKETNDPRRSVTF